MNHGNDTETSQPLRRDAKVTACPSTTATWLRYFAASPIRPSLLHDLGLAKLRSTAPAPSTLHSTHVALRLKPFCLDRLANTVLIIRSLTMHELPGSPKFELNNAATTSVHSLNRVHLLHHVEVSNWPEPHLITYRGRNEEDSFRECTI